MTIGELFSTSDGGQVWRELPTPPIYGALGFTSPAHGWLVGGPRGNQLHITQNGGQHWDSARPLTRPSAADASKETKYGHPVFSDDQHGVLPVTYILGKNSVFATYDTTDGGLTWRIDAFSPRESPTVAASGFDSTLVRAFRGGGKLITRIKTPTASRFAQNTAEVPAGLPTQSSSDAAGSVTSAGNVSQISFVDEQHGWYVYSWNHCSGFKTGCSFNFKLLSTQDGGATLTDITPPFPASSASHGIGGRTLVCAPECSGRMVFGLQAR